MLLPQESVTNEGVAALAYAAFGLNNPHAYEAIFMMRRHLSRPSRAKKEDGVATYTLTHFVDEMTALIAEEQKERQIVQKAKPLLVRLLQNKEFLPAACQRVLHSDWPSQFPLYRAADNTLSVTAVVWGPGHFAPSHDHRTWGLIGVYSGQMRETRYQRVDDSSRPEYAELRQVGVNEAREGEVWHLLPPDEEIHKMENVSDQPTIEIHVYGRDLLHYPRHRFNLETGAITPFMTKEYDIME